MTRQLDSLQVVVDLGERSRLSWLLNAKADGKGDILNERPMDGPGTGWRFSRAFWVANGVELLERAAWYGVFVAITLYLSRILGFSDMEAAAVSGIFSAGLYLLPTFSGAYADRIGFGCSSPGATLGDPWVLCSTSRDRKGAGCVLRSSGVRLPASDAAAPLRSRLGDVHLVAVETLVAAPPARPRSLTVTARYVHLVAVETLVAAPPAHPASSRSRLVDLACDSPRPVLTAWQAKQGSKGHGSIRFIGTVKTHCFSDGHQHNSLLLLLNLVAPADLHPSAFATRSCWHSAC